MNGYLVVDGSIGARQLALCAQSVRITSYNSSVCKKKRSGRSVKFLLPEQSVVVPPPCEKRQRRFLPSKKSTCAMKISEPRGCLMRKLRDVAQECSERRLHRAAEWAAELFSAISERDTGPRDSPNETKEDIDQCYYDTDENSSNMNISESRYFLARSYFDTKQYERCAWALSGLISLPGIWSLLRSRVLFLWCHAMLLLGEEKRNDALGPVFGPTDHGERVTNPNLSTILARLEQCNCDCEADPATRSSDVLSKKSKKHSGPSSFKCKSDPWLLYMKGRVLFGMARRADARVALVSSVRSCPGLWAAWQLLAQSTSTSAHCEAVLTRTSNSPGKLFYAVDCYVNGVFTEPSVAEQAMLELERVFDTESNSMINQTESGVQKRSIMSLNSRLPTSIAALRAKLQYIIGNSPTLAAQSWAAIGASDPYCVDHVDSHAGLLFLMDRVDDLSMLAKHATEVAREKPETLIAVANLYSALRKHERAAAMLRRALYLDRLNGSAWVLLGHEYVELRRVEAAVEAYRRATTINKCDYRGWAGLGAVYTLLGMYPFAAEYYMTALSHRPRDAQLWATLANTFDRLGQTQEARMAASRANEIAITSELPGADESNISVPTEEKLDKGVKRKKYSDARTTGSSNGSLKSNDKVDVFNNINKAN